MPDSSEPEVSVVLPTFNCVTFLDEVFDSIRAQTLANWESIVVDDGRHGRHATRVVAALASTGFGGRILGHVYQENWGPAAARNAGIDLARGRYVAFFDSDDLWLPLHLAACKIAALESNPARRLGACAACRHPRSRKAVTTELEREQLPSARRAPSVSSTDDAGTGGRFSHHHGILTRRRTQMIANAASCVDFRSAQQVRRRVFGCGPGRQSSESPRIKSSSSSIEGGFQAGLFRSGSMRSPHRVHDDSSSTRSSPGTIDKASRWPARTHDGPQKPLPEPRPPDGTRAEDAVRASRD